MNASIKVEQLNEAIQNALQDYHADLVKKLKKETKSAIKMLVKTTKETAPVGEREKHYRDYIASRTVKDTEVGIVMQWYVKAPAYRLSHLLENGHATRNGGRVKGTNFISNAVNTVVKDYVQKVEKVCRNGS